MRFICRYKEKTIFPMRRLTRCFWFSVCVIFLFLSALPFASSNEVIAHPGVEKTLSLNTLRSIYSMRLQAWPDGTGVTVFILDPLGESHHDFCLKVLQIFPYQLQRVWDVLVFSGTGQSPVVVESEEEMISKIRSIPGSIGYIIKSEVPIDVKKINVK